MKRSEETKGRGSHGRCQRTAGGGGARGEDRRVSREEVSFPSAANGFFGGHVDDVTHSAEHQVDRIAGTGHVCRAAREDFSTGGELPVRCGEEERSRTDEGVGRRMALERRKKQGIE